MQTMEGMLAGMKERLAGLETNLQAKLAAMPAAAAPPKKNSSSAYDILDEDLEPDDLDALCPSPGPSPKRPPLSLDRNGPDPQMGRTLSQMSALPDDVIDAVENPDLSDPEDGDGEAGGGPGDELESTSEAGDGGGTWPSSAGGGAAGAGPTAAAATFSVSKVAAGMPSSGTSNALGYG